MQDSQPLTIGISTLGGGGWLGGVNYILNVVQALASLPKSKRPRICLVVRERELTILDQFSSIFPFIYKLLICGPVQPSEKIVPIKKMEAAFAHIDFLFPVLASVLDDPTLPAGSWITDFQHKHLPNFFSRTEIDERNRSFQNIAGKAKHVVFSSKTALHDFETFFPDNHATKHVLRFTSSMDPGLLLLEPSAIAHKHDLNRPYLICCNQFWAHKDHLTAFRAMSLLNKSGLDVTLACTGGMNDYRNSDYFPSLLGQVESLGIQNNIIFLGELPRTEQVALIRGSLAMLQPSLFEGWSTVVEDARSLGKTIFLTDLPVHKEQNPQYGIYFPTGNAKALATEVASIYQKLFEIDSESREAMSLLEMENRRLRFGLELMNIARQSITQTSANQKKTNILSNVTKPYLVSAIVSTYNSELHIEGCLQDLINQTLYAKGELEIIVIDSASTQNESFIIQKYASNYPHIDYKRTQERESIYAAWNRGIHQAKGKYITNANTDDRHRKDALEILATALDNEESIDVVYADQLITEVPNQTFENATPVGKFTWPEFKFDTLLEFCCVGPQPMWRRSLHEKGNKFFNENLEVAGDYDFWLSVANNNFKKINKTLGLYYRSKNSTNKEFQNIKITQLESYMARENAFQRHIQYYTEEDIIEKINNAITSIYDPCDFILKTNYSGKIFRYLEHKCWIICMLLEKIGFRDLAADFAQSKIKYFPQFYNLKNYLNSKISSDCTHHKANIDHIIKTLKLNDIFYLNLSDEDIFFFLNAKISNKTLTERAFLYQNIATELLKNNISQDDSDYVFFIYGIILCNFKKFIDVKNLFQDIYINKLGSQRLNKIFEISLTSKYEKQLKIENNNKISVIIPLFNQGHFLDKTIQSIINQTYQNFEIIIVNDGSTDNSLTIAENIQNKFTNHKIILFSHDNHGKGFTRNKGVIESSGDYICILDADDMIASTYLEKSLQYFDSDENLGWVIPQTFQFGSKHNNLHWTWDYNFVHSLIQCPAPVSAIYRKQIWTEVGGYCETMTDREDWDFWICAGELGWYGKTTDTVEFLYRKHDVRWGERSEINIASKKEIIMRHPWFYKNFSDQQLTSAATFHPTGVFPEHVLDKKAVSLVPQHPVSRQEFSAAMSTIKQLYAERTDTSNSKRRILFYFFKNVHIPILLPLYQALKSQNADVDIAFSYLPPSPDIRAGLLPDEVRIIEQAGMPIYATPQEFRPDLTFIADSVYPWVEGCGKLVHVGHGVLSKGQYYTDTPTARREELADLVCVPGKHHQGIMRRIISKPVVATGMCKLDDLFSGKINRASVIKEFGLPEDYRYVLFAPTFNDELSAIPYVKDRIGDVLPGDKTLLIVKLHPSTKPEYKEMYRALPSRDKRVIYADELDITPFLALCDVMISDVSSAMMEFAALDKPVVLFNNPNWASYQNYNPADIEFQWRDIGIQVADLDEIKEAVSRYLEDPILHADKRKKYTDLLFANKRDGNAAQRIVKLALSLLEAEQKR